MSTQPEEDHDPEQPFLPAPVWEAVSQRAEEDQAAWYSVAQNAARDRPELYYGGGSIQDTAFFQGLSQETQERYLEMLRLTRIDVPGVMQTTNAHEPSETPAVDIDSIMTEYNDHDRTFRRVYLNHPRQSGHAAAAESTYQRFMERERELRGRVEQRYAEHLPAWQAALQAAGEFEPEASQHNVRTEMLEIPMELVEPVDIEQINAIVENRRVHSAFGTVLQELGLGNERGDQDFQVTMRKAIDAIKNLKAHINVLTGELNRATLAMQSMTEQPPAEARMKHGHDTQWRILNLEEEVLESSEWSEGSDGDYARDRMKERLSDWQLQGEDVFLAEYHRCRWVNLTTRKERER